MIGGDDNESLFEFSDLLEVLESSLDSLVEFHELSESSGVVESVHLLVDRGSLTNNSLSISTSLRGASGSLLTT